MVHLTAVLAGLILAGHSVAVPLEPCEPAKLKSTILVGDGDPHQNFVYKQVSGVTDCADNPGGSAAVTSGRTVGYSLSISGAFDFITGGFSVDESKSTGTSNSFGCSTKGGGSQTGNLCVFQRIQTTAYTVNSQTCTVNNGNCLDDPPPCTPDDGPNAITYAPNDVQGSCFYDNIQLGLPCGLMDAEIQIHDGPVGGPQFIDCQDWLPPKQ